MPEEPTATLPAAAVVAVGTELTCGLAEDTNGSAVSRELLAYGFEVPLREVVADDRALLASRIRDLATRYALVVVTGGLGPTHDDVTRESAADALGVSLERDRELAVRLERVVARHSHPGAASQVLRQADVLAGARVLQPTLGTAPGQLVQSPAGHLLLLPGPPREMEPMLSEALRMLTGRLQRAPRVRVLSCVDIPESDAQLAAEGALAGRPGVKLTVLGRPALVDVVLVDSGGGPDPLAVAATEVAAALGDRCYTTDGSSLASAVITSARSQRATIALAESCTGGLISAALTDVPGSSDVFLGGAIAYSNALKERFARVTPQTLERYGAVSGETAREMADGIRRETGADFALAVTGIAGPGGGGEEKPVGTVWFALGNRHATSVELRRFGGDRFAVRARTTAIGLDLLRRALASGDGSTP